MKLFSVAFFALSMTLMCHEAFAAKTQPAKNEPKQEVMQDRLENSLRVDFWYGGWEADYTKSAYELMLSYRDLGKLHLFTGIGDAKQIYYNRSKVYAGGYYFYQDSSYIKAFVAKKTYDYPTDPATLTVNPDSSSYRTEPKLELELSHRFKEDLLGRLSYEVTRPSFFHDPSASVTNQKLGGELNVATPLPGLHAKLYAALLRDPDPSATEIRGRDNPRTALGAATNTAVVYKTSRLYGAAIEYVWDKWEVEVKLLQNRDLDDSYDYSIFNKLIYRVDDDRHLQVDYLHDEFSGQSNFAGQSADVQLFSYYQRYSPKLKFGVGFKRIAVPNRTDDTAFVFVQANTGLLLK